MKHKILKLNIIVLFFAFISAGCQKDELINEHFPFKLEYSIQNEEGKEVSKIKEGENFFIYFSIENIGEKDSPINDHHLFANGELFNLL